MNILDMIGPIMVGPSSSHTAGLVRIGNVAYRMLGVVPSVVDIKFHGSLAKTYKGHGSDKAIVAGLLGYKPDDERIRDSLRIADEQGVAYSFSQVDLPGAHPNTVLVSAATRDGRTLTLRAESVGGGNILIRNIDDIEAELDGQYDTLVVRHNDTPGVIALVTNILAVMQVNIADMRVYRSRKGGDAIMVISIDGQMEKKWTHSIAALPNVNRATVIWGIKH